LRRSINDISATVLHPCRFIAAAGFGLLFTERDGFHLRVTSTRKRHGPAHRLGTLLTEREVIFAATPLIGVALNDYLAVGVRGKELAVGFNQRTVLFFNGVLVVVEINAALGEDVRGVVYRVDCRCTRSAAGTSRFTCAA
jgi:hypothetical protein